MWTGILYCLNQGILFSCTRLEILLHIDLSIHVCHRRLIVHEDTIKIWSNLSYFWQYNAILIVTCSTFRTCYVSICFNPTSKFSWNNEKNCAILISCLSRVFRFLPFGIQKLYRRFNLSLKHPAQNHSQVQVAEDKIFNKFVIIEKLYHNQNFLQLIEVHEEEDAIAKKEAKRARENGKAVERWLGEGKEDYQKIDRQL